MLFNHLYFFYVFYWIFNCLYLMYVSHSTLKTQIKEFIQNWSLPLSSHCSSLEFLNVVRFLFSTFRLFYWDLGKLDSVPSSCESLSAEYWLNYHTFILKSKTSFHRKCVNMRKRSWNVFANFSSLEVNNNIFIYLKSWKFETVSEIGRKTVRVIYPLLLTYFVYFNLELSD